MRSFLLLLMSAAVVAACGGSVTVDDAGGGSSSTGTTSKSSTGTGVVPGPCPATVPSGGACTKEGLFCTYGDDPRPQCRASARCEMGTWSIVMAKCVAIGGAECGAGPQNGMGCPTEGDVCAYGDGTLCGCTSCFGGPCGPPPPLWQCSAPSAGCPPLAPNAGTGCSKSGQSCSYGQPCGISGVDMVCTSGAWLWNETPLCPL